MKDTFSIINESIYLRYALCCFLTIMEKEEPGL